MLRAQNTLLGRHGKRIYSSKTARAIKPLADFSRRGDSRLKIEGSFARLGLAAESRLRIQIINKRSFSAAMGIRKANDPPPSSATDLYLEEIGLGQISAFNPDSYPEMNSAACSFLLKLRTVSRINVNCTAVPQEKLYIDNMAVDLLKSVQYDDGREFSMSPCALRLSIGEKQIEVRADKEGRRGNGIIWVMQENGHVDSNQYKYGDIQLASCMIAAYQSNSRQAKGVYPRIMMGVKISGDNVHFYSMKMTASYLDDLTRGAPGEDIKVFKYSSKMGLRISVPKDRKQILNHLWSMRCYAAGLKKFGRYWLD